MTPTFVAVLVALAPLALFVGLMIGGRYPGERALERVRAWFEPEAHPRAATSSRPRLVFTDSRARGSALLASNLAGRGPPGFLRPT